MKLFDLEKEAKEELGQEDLQMAKGEIKERLREIRSAERVLAKLKAKYIKGENGRIWLGDIEIGDCISWKISMAPWYRRLLFWWKYWRHSRR